MKSLRKLAAIILSIALPGLGAATIGQRTSRRIVTGVTVVVLAAAAVWVKTRNKMDFIRLGTSPTAMLIAAIAAAAFGLFHAWSVYDTWRVVREKRTATWATTAVGVLAVGMLVPYLWASSTALDHRTTLMQVFGSDEETIAQSAAWDSVEPARDTPVVEPTRRTRVRTTANTTSNAADTTQNSLDTPTTLRPRTTATPESTTPESTTPIGGTPTTDSAPDPTTAAGTTPTSASNTTTSTQPDGNTATTTPSRGTTTTPAGTTTTSKPPTTQPPSTTQAPTPSLPAASTGPVTRDPNRRTFLLIGGDAGQGRWSRRTDTMIVVTTNLRTGATAMVSVPRNLRNLPFPQGPLRNAFPNGYTDLANAVYVWGDSNRGAVPGAADAGIEVLRQGIQEFTGWYIDDYVLVDMEGFVKVVDAIGGIDIVTTSVLPTGMLPGSGRQVGGFKEGERRHLDGEEALAYSRSRTGSSDYSRMKRQRCVINAIAQRGLSFDVLSHLGDIQNVVRNFVHTDVPLSELPALVAAVDRITSGRAVSLVFAPPVIAPSDWNLGYVRALTQATWQVANGLPVNVQGLDLSALKAVEDLKSACPK